MSESVTQSAKPDERDLTGTTIGRFSIGQRLGAGGMGEVYRAEDNQLKRTVAIKRLTKRVQDNSARTELLREARRASALNHPGIAGVYDIFSDKDEFFLVMEYIDGQTLKDRMLSPISLSEFHVIAIQCAEALSAAHKKGILHGDLKPANIMLTREKNEVKICDFGLARRVTVDNSSDTVSATRPGIAGTPAYLAPEIVLEKPVGLTADIFSLGVMFYEMLSGRNPFAADSLIATINRIRDHTPEPLNTLNPEVPVPLAAIITRMLQKNPAERYATAEELKSDLSTLSFKPFVERPARWRLALVAASTILTVALLARWDWTGRHPPASLLPEKISVAVLPFEVIGAAAEQQFFTQGMAETLNAQLAKLTVNRNLQVATAADTRSRNVKNAKDARAQFGANVALSCSLQFADTDVRINCGLIETASEKLLTAETITANVTDSFAVQDRLVDAVVRMMALNLKPEERTVIAGHGTQQPGAFDFYLQGRGYLANYDRVENLDNTVSLFRRALEVDPQYALAYAGLGEAFWRKHDATKSAEWVDLARGACEGALAIDAKRAESHACMGMVLNGRGQYSEAAAEFGTALGIDPTNDAFYVGLANAYEKVGRPSDAEDTYRRAIDLRPHYWGAYSTLGAYLYRIGRHDDAIKMFQQVVALAPDSFRGYSNLGAAYFMRNQFEDAISAFSRSLAIRPNYPAASNLGTLYYFQGQYRRSADAFREALSLNDGNYQVWLNLADALFWANDPEASKETYRQARTRAEQRAKINPQDAFAQMALAFCSAALGEKDKAMDFVRRVIRLAPTDSQTLFQMAVFFEYRAAQRDEALAWLSKAVERGQTWTEIDNAPALRELRKDPRFQQMRNKR